MAANISVQKQAWPIEFWIFVHMAREVKNFSPTLVVLSTFTIIIIIIIIIIAKVIYMNPEGAPMGVIMLIMYLRDFF